MTNINITPIEDMGSLSDEMMDNIIRHEREAYGYEGFGEYLFCSDPECRRIQSIDEVYGVKDTDEEFVPLKELEKSGPETPCCPECGSDSLLIFDPAYFRDYLRELFEGAYGALILDQKGLVQGSTFVKPEKLKKFFDENMDYKETFEWEHFRQRVEELLGIPAEPDTDMMIWNRVSIGHQHRGGRNFNQLVATALNIHPEFDDRPSFGATRFDSALYPILKPIGFADIDTDELGTVSVGIDRIGRLREALNLPFEEFKERFSQERAKVIAWQKKQPKAESGPKFYKGAKLFDRFQLDDERNQNNIEIYSESRLSQSVLIPLANAFREIFNNSYGYGQWIFYPSEGRPISPQEAIGTDRFIDVKTLDNIDLASLNHPETGETPKLWHDPKKVEKNILQKLKFKGQLALIRGKQGRIEGFSFGYPARLQQAFALEEWQNPWNYSNLQNTGNQRSLDNFIEALQKAIPNRKLNANTQIYVWNAFGIHPSHEGQGLIKKLSKQVARQIPEDIVESEICLLEVESESPSHKIFEKAGGITVPEALGKENDIVLIAIPLKELVDYFLKSKK